MPVRISVVIPALNEARHIERCVRSVREQAVEGEFEVLVVDGDSDDGTAVLAQAAGAEVLANPARTIPAALNVGLAAARGSTLVRFDAHAEMPAGYLSRCLEALDREADAVNVGGWREPRGETAWGRAAGAALASPFGVGNSRLWRRPQPGTPRREVETVPLGCFPVEALREAGGWREDLLANEDFELNHRLRLRGGRVIFDPAVWSIYRPRESLADIAAQYWRYGRWKASVLRRSPRSLRLRQLPPVGLLGALAGSVLPGPAGWVARGLVVAYALSLIVAAVRARAGWRTVPVLATMHLLWGVGVLAGLVGGGAVGPRRDGQSGPAAVGRLPGSQGD